MSTTQICPRCGGEYLAEFNSKTGREEMITGCECDKVEERLRKQIKKLKKEKEELKEALEVLLDTKLVKNLIKGLKDIENGKFKIH